MIDDHALFLVKGVLGFTGIMMLVIHMHRVTTTMDGWGQTMRYVTLLAFALVVTYASWEQVRQDAIWEFRHTGSLVATMGLNITMFVSIWEQRSQRDGWHQRQDC